MLELCSLAVFSCPEFDLILLFDFSAVYAFEIFVLVPEDDEDELLIPLPLAFTNIDFATGELDDLLTEEGFDSGDEVVFCDMSVLCWCTSNFEMKRVGVAN